MHLAPQPSLALIFSNGFLCYWHFEVRKGYEKHCNILEHTKQAAYCVKFAAKYQ